MGDGSPQRESDIQCLAGADYRESYARFFLSRLPKLPPVDNRSSKSQLPAVAAAVAEMEAAHLPLGELRKRYTKSEMVLGGWRSTEIAGNMEMMRVTTPANYTASGIAPVGDDKFDALEKKLQPFLHKIVDKDGEIDLRGLTGDEVIKYMKATSAVAMRRGM